MVEEICKSEVRRKLLGSRVLFSEQAVNLNGLKLFERILNMFSEWLLYAVVRGRRLMAAGSSYQLITWQNV